MPHWFGLDLDPLLVGSLAIVGHCFPLFAGFRGGKAAATTAGVLVVANLPLFLTGFLTFTLSIAVFKYVALGTMLGGLALFVYACLAGDGVYMVLTGMLFLLLIYLHRSNIRNFLNGTEMKVTDKRLKRDRLTPLKKRPRPFTSRGPNVHRAVDLHRSTAPFTDGIYSPTHSCTLSGLASTHSAAASSGSMPSWIFSITSSMSTGSQ